MKQVLISGGRGLIGSRLSQKLKEKGYAVHILTRNKSKLDSRHFYWNIDDMEMDEKSLTSVDYIIHLAGERIADKRWSDKQKSKIIQSRTDSSRLIIDTLKKNKLKPKAIISSSAIGYYGFEGASTIFKETDPASKGFLGSTCEAWEEEINKAKALSIRTVIIRTGIVLSKHGGAIKKMNAPTRLGLGAALGTGKQFMPWIHIDDLCDIFITALEQEKWSGPYNGVAPEHTTNKEFTQALAKSQGKKVMLPNVPGIILKLALGEMSQMLLKGNRISSEKLLQAGFKFKFPTLDKALNKIFGA